MSEKLTIFITLRCVSSNKRVMQVFFTRSSMGKAFGQKKAVANTTAFIV